MAARDAGQDWVSFFLDGVQAPGDGIPDAVSEQWKRDEVAGEPAPCGITWRSFWEIARRHGAWQAHEEGH